MVYWGIAGGAVLGAWSRFALQTVFSVYLPQFPFGTFLANAIGCFLIGLLFPLISHWPIEARLSVITGFLGSLTTLSSLSWEVLQLFSEKRFAAAMLHWSSGAVLAIFLSGVGWWLGDKLARG